MPSLVGPVILVCVGVVALLVVTGHIDSGAFWTWYGQWWPLLLIGAGLALLAEWALDMRRKTPVRRSGGFIGILIVLAIVGAVAAAHNHFWGPLRPFRRQRLSSTPSECPSTTATSRLTARQIPANASIEILIPRGDVSITAGDEPNLEVQAHEVAYANSDAEAKKIFERGRARDSERQRGADPIAEQLARAREPDRDRAEISQGDGECGHGTT